MFSNKIKLNLYDQLSKLTILAFYGVSQMLNVKYSEFLVCVWDLLIGWLNSAH